MKIRLLIIFLYLLCNSSFAQIRLDGYRQSEIDSRLYNGRWPAYWISLPNEPVNVYGVYHFRKTIELSDFTEKFIVHVSADNRYKLYINGQLISLGPARGDIYNWNFETVDLAPYLKKGKNTIAAVVWNFAEHSPLAQISFKQTGFILQGNTDKEEIVNTNSSWKCTRNNAYSPWNKPVIGYYAAGSGEQLEAKDYLWGWEQPEYDDSEWIDAHQDITGAMKGGQDYPGRLLVPSPIPPMEMEVERLSSVRHQEGIRCDENFPSKRKSFIIPANSKVQILLDNKHLTTGYLSIMLSKGKNSEIEIGYAESLYTDEKTAAKGNRDEVTGKKFIGYQDKIIADGGNNRNITTLWWRTWRYINLSITTGDEPLIFEDIYGTTSRYPFENKSSFSAPENEYLSKILDVGWRTARLCANETYMDCPYYEQLQYFGDARIQAMVTMYNTHDNYMVKNALEQGRQSIIADGITMSRYPSGLHQFISSFSLWWICSGHDYWMYRGDETYLKSLLPAYRGILAWYEQWLKDDYSLNYVPYWFFADWSNGFPTGEPIREKEGNSAFQDLLYIIALESAAQMEDSFGMKSMAKHYQDISSNIRRTFNSKYWNASRELFADTHDHRNYSQHVNTLAILAKIIEGDEAANLMIKLLNDKSLTQATIYFRYYLHQALKKSGMGDLFLNNLQIWKDQLSLGLTTWAEQPEPSRSDCHAWGASPNIEFYRIVLGIDSDSPGFRRIRIAPSLSMLKEVSGSMPHPEGSISVSYKLSETGTFTASIDLPKNTTGVFIWKDQEYELTEGMQILAID